MRITERRLLEEPHVTRRTTRPENHSLREDRHRSVGRTENGSVKISYTIIDHSIFRSYISTRDNVQYYFSVDVS